MCYSARIIHDWRRYVRAYGAELDLAAFVELFWRRLGDPRLKVPKAMEIALLEVTGERGADPSARAIADHIAAHAAAEATRLEQELFAQRKRLADAERKLAVASTKAALESRRIAGDKITRALDRMTDLRRRTIAEQDERIYPGVYAPVIVIEDGRLVVKPMRYQCRPAGKPAHHDVKFPGTYNARRDSLRGYWKELFGYSHGVMLVSSFYENVDRLVEGGGTKNQVLEFRPRPANDMLVACLWSRWSAPGEPELLSFAAITNEPPAEIAAAGHDRCIVVIKPEHLQRWLSPATTPVETLHEILEDREPLYYEHALAA